MNFKASRSSAVSAGMSMRVSGKVDAFLGAEFLAFRTGLRDFDGDRIGIHRVDDAANLPVVKPNWLAGLGVIEHLRKRDTNLCRREEFSRLVVRGWLSDRARSGQDENVSGFKQQRLWKRGKFAYASLCVFLNGTRSRFCASNSGELQSGHEVNGLLCLRPATFAQNLGNMQGALRPAGIVEADPVTGPESLQENGESGTHAVAGPGAGSGLSPEVNQIRAGVTTRP